MTIPTKNFSDYFFENISTDAINQIQIASKCNGNCIFCSNNQNPFKIHRCDFREIDEIEKIIWSMPDDMPYEIILNESLPGRISEGEALLHPKLFEILSLIRNKFQNNVIQITTNGSLLNNDLIKELKKFTPMLIRLSLPSTKKEYWKETFSLGDNDYNNAINSISLLRQNNINVESTIIPMPSWVGYKDIEETIKFINSYFLNQVLIYAPGYTDKTKKEAVKKMEYNKLELSDFLQEMSKKYSIMFHWSLDPNIFLSIDSNSIENILKFFWKNNIQESCWLTSVSSYDRFKILMEQLTRNVPIKYEIIPVNNNFYGGNIECTGLWVINDIKDLNLKNRNIVLPNNFLDKYGFDLTGKNIVDFTKESENSFTFV